MSYTVLQRSELKRKMADGLPVFRLGDDGRPELLEGCQFPGKLEYEVLGYERDGHSGSRATDVDVNVARFGSAGLKREARSGADVVLVGAWESAIDSPQIESLSGACRGATHLASVVLVGAFEAGDSSTTQVGGGAGVEGIAGTSANHERSQELSAAGGKIEDCEMVSSADVSPPGRCDAPIYVKLVPLGKRNELEYYFEDQVVGARTADAAVTADDLTVVSTALEQDLERRGQAHGVKITALSAPSPTAVTCRVTVSTSPGMYLLECFRGDTLIVQESGELQVLERLTPKVAGLLIASANPAQELERPVAARRVVMLVDVSASMLVNDEATFTSDDVRRSKRYELVMLLLRGMQENGINPEVGIIAFSADGCMEPVVLDGQTLWSLTDTSRDHALHRLQQVLRRAPDNCADSTDLVGPLRMASELLQAKQPGPGKDVVILITDGAQQAQTSKITPQAAAAELRKAGAELAVVRVQLNDLTDLRTALNGPDRPDILARWAGFVNDKAWVDAKWQFWLENFPKQNDEGDALLDNLNHVDVSKFFLSADDVRSEALLTVHEQLLPQVGGLDPVFTTNDSKLDKVEGVDGNINVYTEYRLRVVRGRPFTIRIKKPECMGRVVSANVMASGQGRIPLKVLWEDGAIVTFEKIEVDEVSSDAAEGRTRNNEIVLMIEGESTRGMRQCQI